MENDQKTVETSLVMMGEITRGTCDRCRNLVDGVNRKYYCPLCGNVGEF
jgi:Zn finger protein HypA/HybF involved in hydrogenase expression